MQRNLNTRFGRFRLMSWITLTVAAMAMTACGPLGDDESDPTATAESMSQPALSSAEDAAATPGTEDLPPDPVLATPATSFSTPGVNDLAGTPDQPFTVIVGTPAAPEPAGTVDATPFDAAPSLGVAGSDGTTGATPNSGNAPPAAPPDSTPTDYPAAAVVATPGAGATSEAVELAELAPVPVGGCDPETIPPFNGTQVIFLTVSDVNFRTGPGADCDIVGDGPLGTNVPVTVLSGPVIREDEGQFTWVQVQVFDQTGWVIAEALEPAS